MKKSDKERLKKIVSTWENLSRQIQQRGITPELLLEDEFAQWAVTTPLYNIGKQVYQLSSRVQSRLPGPAVEHGGRPCGTALCMITTVSTGPSSWKSSFPIWTLLWMLYGRSWPGCEKLPRQKTFFCRFKKQGSAPVLGFIFRFVKRVQLFVCFFETFSAFPLL